MDWPPLTSVLFLRIINIGYTKSNVFSQSNGVLQSKLKCSQNTQRHSALGEEYLIADVVKTIELKI